MYCFLYSWKLFSHSNTCFLISYVVFNTKKYFVEIYTLLFFLLIYRYSGPSLDEGQFAAAVDSTAVTRDFSKLVEWIATELAAVDKLEEHIHSIESGYIPRQQLVLNILCMLP